MSAFNPPKSVPSDVSLAWIEESQTGFGSPALLRGDLWRRFNLVTIPLLSPHEFFTDALAACRDSITGDELAAKLAAKHALRKAELDETLRLLARGPFNPITANRTHIAAARAASHASLANFVRLTAGCSQTEGWGKVDTQSGGGLDQFDYLLPRDDWHRQDYPGGISQTQYPAFEYNIDEPPGQEDETLGKGYERPCSGWVTSGRARRKQHLDGERERPSLKHSRADKESANLNQRSHRSQRNGNLAAVTKNSLSECSTG